MTGVRWVLIGVLAALLPPAGRVSGQAPFQLPVVNGLDEFVPVPDDNPLQLPKLLLGRRLFFDTGLSRDGTRACASCHSPALSFSDSVPVSRGVGGHMGRRNAPAIINRGYGTSFFWDGRAASLEQQVLGPLQSPSELGSSLADVVTRLASDTAYARQFAWAFGRPPDASGLAQALATYVRSIRSGNSRFDQYAAGDTAALTTEERRGLALFNGAARCTRCHAGPNFTDEDFHNTGVAAGTADHGREDVTRRPEDRGKFRTPTLRDVARTAPYMHNGSISTLESVVAFYDSGGRANPALDPELRRLNLSAEARQDLVAFLRALSSPATDCGLIQCIPQDGQAGAPGPHESVMSSEWCPAPGAAFPRRDTNVPKSRSDRSLGDRAPSRIHLARCRPVSR